MKRRIHNATILQIPQLYVTQLDTSTLQITQLPDELLIRILSSPSLHLPDIAHFAIVCTSFRQITLSNFLWRARAHVTWPLLTTVPSENWRQTYRTIMKGPYRPCYECGVYPLVGVRWECLQCVDAHLCATCEEKATHPKNHLLMKTFFPEEPIRNPPSLIPHRIDCLTCHTEVNPGAVMYATAECAILCKTCFETLVPPYRKYWKIKAPPERIFPKARVGNNPRAASCDVGFEGCLVACTGVDWKCVRCDDFDICERCQLSFENPNFTKTVKNHSRSCAVIKVFYSDCCFFTKWQAEIDWNVGNLSESEYEPGSELEESDEIVSDEIV